MGEFERFVSVAEFGKMSGLGESRVRRMIQEGALPVLRAGRRIKIKPSVAYAALDTMMKGGASND